MVTRLGAPGTAFGVGVRPPVRGGVRIHETARYAHHLLRLRDRQPSPAAVALEAAILASTQASKAQ